MAIPLPLTSCPCTGFIGLGPFDSCPVRLTLSFSLPLLSSRPRGWQGRVDTVTAMDEEKLPCEQHKEGGATQDRRLEPADGPRVQNGTAASEGLSSHISGPDSGKTSTLAGTMEPMRDPDVALSGLNLSLTNGLALGQDGNILEDSIESRPWSSGPAEEEDASRSPCPDAEDPQLG